MCRRFTAYMYIIHFIFFFCVYLYTYIYHVYPISGCNKRPATNVQTSEYLEAPDLICTLYMLFLFFRLTQSHPRRRTVIVGLIRFGHHRRRFRYIRSATHLWRQPWVPCPYPSVVVLVATKCFVLPLDNVHFM